jgi:phosphoribosylanthranilate isomerase
VPDEITKVGVFVNEDYEKMLELIDAYKIQGIQLHGSESPEICKALKSQGKTVIKVFPGTQLLKIEILEAYEKYVDYFLFDTPVQSYGGSGRKFDWSILQKIALKKKFFLSGGISLEDHFQLKKINNTSLYAVDINSRFELSPGIKNPFDVSEFLNKIRNDEEE